jgi:HK97 family phage major capsid protein
MRNIQELKAEVTRLLAEGESLLDLAEEQGRGLSSAEEKRYTEIVATVRRLNIDIAKAERDGTVGEVRPIVAELDDTPILGALDEPRSRIALPGHGVRMRAFANNRAGREDAYKAGKWLQATLMQNSNAARWCQSNGLTVDIMAAAATSPNTAGGALVPEFLNNRIIDLREQFGLFRQQADVVQMSSTTEIFARRVGKLTAAFTGEGAAATESDVTWDNVELTAKKVCAYTRMSSEVSDDAIVNMADRFTFEIAMAFAELEDVVGFCGVGSAAHGGIVGVLVVALQAAHSKAKVTASGAANSCDSFSEVTSDHLLDLMSAIPQYAKRGAAWYCSATAKSLVFDAIKISGGGTTSQLLAERMDDSFLGFPIHVTTVMPDDPSADLSGLAMLGFGNLRMAAMMGSRRETRVSLSEHRYFELDQIAVKGTERFDINVCNMGSTSEKSPFAVLVGN